MSVTPHVANAVNAERERSKAILEQGRACSAPKAFIVSAIMSGMKLESFQAEVIAHRIAAA